MRTPDGTIWNWSEIVRQAREVRARADRARSVAREDAVHGAAARRKLRRGIAAVTAPTSHLSLVRRAPPNPR